MNITLKEMKFENDVCIKNYSQSHETKLNMHHFKTIPTIHNFISNSLSCNSLIYPNYHLNPLLHLPPTCQISSPRSSKDRVSVNHDFTIINSGLIKIPHMFKKNLILGIPRTSSPGYKITTPHNRAPMSSIKWLPLYVIVRSTTQ